MQFFIDTANLNEIREAQSLGVLDGVTTNPSLMAKEGITGKNNILSHYKAICDLVEDNVSAEVISTDFDGMVREGEELSEIDSHPIHLIECAKAGADVATIPYSVIMSLLKHPLTDSGLEKFLADYRKGNS